VRLSVLGEWNPQQKELEANFYEFSACSDAEAVFGNVIGVAVIMAPRGSLLMIHMPNDRPRDHTDGCADDQSTSYQLFHLTLAPSVGSAKQ
jgi:hypothetical protein